MMDNKIFNVNGSGYAMLEQTLILAFMQSGGESYPSTAKGWIFNKDKGLILLWSVDGRTDVCRFPIPMFASDVVNMVYKWLGSNEALTMTFTGWDADADHDGCNELGWRVYVEDWGKVGGDSGAICAVRPSYNWLGK